MRVADYNPHYLRYDALFAACLTLGLYVFVGQWLSLSLVSLSGRGALLCSYLASFFVVVGWRTTVQQEREKPFTKRGTRVLSPVQFNHHNQGDGIGIPHQHKGSTTLLRIRSEDEATHIQIAGDTGTGKSALFHYFLNQLAERDQDNVIIYDPSGEYWKRHATKDDLWLCPFSEDCPYWDLAEEIIDGERYPTLLAKSFIPPEQGAKPNFWEKGSRAIMVALLKELRRTQGSVSDLVDWMSDQDRISQLVEGTPAYYFVDKGAKEQRAGILATLATAADSLSLLPQQGGRRRFSFARWVREMRKGWLFIGATGVADQELLQPLINVWFDIAIRQLTHSVGALPTWIFIDELASLGHIASLPKALDQSRKYNTRLVLGFQGRSQLQEYYRGLSETMLSACTTKIFLRTSEHEAAVWAARSIGMPEMERLSDSHSRQLSGERASVSSRKDRREEYLILPNEIQNLPKMHGYVRYRDRVTPIQFAYPNFEHEHDRAFGEG